MTLELEVNYYVTLGRHVSDRHCHVVVLVELSLAAAL